MRIQRRGFVGLSRGIKVGLGSFVVAALLIWPSQQAMSRWGLGLVFPLLLVFILVGIVADIVGVAATRAEETPFHARSAKKIKAAGQAIRMIRHADKVAVFCSDFVGDMVGIVSGAAGAAVALRLGTGRVGTASVLAGIMLLAGITALTIGGKAVGKVYAVAEAERVVKTAAEVLFYLEKLTGVRFLVDSRKRQGKGGEGR